MSVYYYVRTIISTAKSSHLYTFVIIVTIVINCESIKYNFFLNKYP